MSFSHQSIYYLHIPRVAGCYVNSNVLPYLISNQINHFVSNRTKIDIEKIKNSKYVSGHFGKFPISLMDKPKIYALIRNPIDRYISCFKYATTDVRSRVELYHELDSWLYGENFEINSNLQSKFITGEVDLDLFNKNVNIINDPIDNYQSLSLQNGWYIKNYDLNFENIKKNINKMNAYSLENIDVFAKDFNNDLNNIFKFQTFKINYKNNMSINMGIDFTKKQLNRIEEINLIDMQLYEYVKKIEKNNVG